MHEKHLRYRNICSACREGNPSDAGFSADSEGPGRSCAANVQPTIEQGTGVHRWKLDSKSKGGGTRRYAILAAYGPAGPARRAKAAFGKAAVARPTFHRRETPLTGLSPLT
ncbi:MAG TPA: hypothetical protein VE986_08005 [Hyphomicrobiales bacterium]|nr:hypothetical protein [Hyphomicrobiales bacterium]